MTKTLEERIREWADEFSGLVDPEAMDALLALLDAPETEPEPTPDAWVTREQLLAALHEVSISVRVAFEQYRKGGNINWGLLGLSERCEDEMQRVAARLRREED